MSGPVKQKPGTTLAGATGQDNYGRRCKFLRRIQRPICALCWRIEHECARIETSHELAKWNRANERSAQ